VALAVADLNLARRRAHGPVLHAACCSQLHGMMTFVLLAACCTA
jgi:hypothetical protein